MNIMTETLNRYREMLSVAQAEAMAGLDEGGIPIGAALFAADGSLLGKGRNGRIQRGDPSAHAETEAFRSSGRQRTYRGAIMVTTLSPCWYCSGLIRQFGISSVVIGDARTFAVAHDWLHEAGIELIVLDDERCIRVMQAFTREHPDLWREDIGQQGAGGEI